MKIKLVSVFVDDPAKAHRFYTETLGFVSKMFLPEAKLAIVASAEDQDGTALLLEPNDSPIAKTYQEAVYRAGMPVIVFGVDDVHGEYRRLKQLGVALRAEPKKTDYGTVATLDDTCGNFVQLHQD